MRGLFLSCATPRLPHPCLPPSRLSLALCVGTLYLWGYFICGDTSFVGTLTSFVELCAQSDSTRGKGTWLIHCSAFWGMVVYNGVLLTPLVIYWGSPPEGCAASTCGSMAFKGTAEAGRLFPFPLGCFFFFPKATHKSTLSEFKRKKHPHPQSCGDPQKNLSKPALLCSLLTTPRPPVSSSYAFPWLSTSSSNPSINYAAFLVWTLVSL